MTIKDKVEKALAETVLEIYTSLPEGHRLEVPSNSNFGLYSSNIAMLLAKQNKSPVFEIARALTDRLKDKLATDMKDIKVAGPGFINFYPSESSLIKTFHQILDQGTSYGKKDLGKGSKVVLEHSNVNPNKAAHIGHMRNAFIGQFIERIYEFYGYEVEVQYYSNDLGLQVAASLFGTEIINDINHKEYEKYDHYLWDVYAKFNALCDRDTEVKKQLEDRMVEADKGEGELFNKQVDFARRVLTENLKTFTDLGVNYDVVITESAIKSSGMWDEALERMIKNPSFYISKEDKTEGCLMYKFGDMENSDLTTENTFIEDKVIVRSNGIPTYTGKDIAYHLWKIGELKSNFQYDKLEIDSESKVLISINKKDSKPRGYYDKIIDVVDVKQTYPLEVVRRAVASLSKKASVTMRHVNYGHVYLYGEENGLKSKVAMSGRKGIGIKIDDICREIEQSILNNFPNTQDIRNLRNSVLRVEILKYNSYIDVIFNKKEALSTKGYSGVYIQYTMARAFSVLGKVKLDLPTENYVLDRDDNTRSFLYELAQYDYHLHNSFFKVAPNLLLEYLYNLCQSFNHYYDKYLVVSESNYDLRLTRTLLYNTFIDIACNCMYLLGMNPVKKM